MEGLFQCPTNYVPLSPISFLQRAGIVYKDKDRVSVIYGYVNYTWKERLERCLRLASALTQLGISRGYVEDRDLVRDLFALVAGYMGKPVGNPESMLKSYRGLSNILRAILNSMVLPLGYLITGLGRHRALLFKNVKDKLIQVARSIDHSKLTAADTICFKVSYSAAESNDLMRQAQIFNYANGNDHPPTAIDLDKSLLKDLLFNQSPSKPIPNLHARDSEQSFDKNKYIHQMGIEVDFSSLEYPWRIGSA
ncbi:hypothetical protein IFM89_038908 [Coptis chinensis]|uniref:EDR1/CTR1/ARMC3-like peptidase-like domain-containing protein n=1 Tax=Coptis chinensis TaxID=261450 RepID=A0A835M636_9MAGN|nr:hypothetical protein IFM89_038908 [Coptis chinensis]